MFPLLISIGSLHIYSLSVALVLSWLIFSFLFWRQLRRIAIEEDRIFDLTFYMSVALIGFARFGYIVTHWSEFVGKSPLLLAAIWVAPGLSWFLGLVGAIVVMVILARYYKIRVGLLLDALAIALPVPIMVGTFGAFLDGSLVGKVAGDIAWAMKYGGRADMHHPIQLYEIAAVLGIAVIIFQLDRIGQRKKWAQGLLGAWYFLLYSGSIFVLEFFKESHVYLWQVSANQWILIGIFAESLGILYVQAGGRLFIKKLGANIYESISKRYAKRDK